MSRLFSRFFTLFYFAIISLLGIATLLEGAKGETFSHHYIYDSTWFALLLSLFAIGMVYMIIKRKLYRQVHNFLLHVSFLVILAGALVTKTTSQRGVLHLVYNQPLHAMSDEATINSAQPTVTSLPFEIALDTFMISYYPASKAPSDYISRVRITDNQQMTTHDISMNHIAEYAGYRIYQSYYDPDMRGSWLTVYYDPWGIAVTYTGYIMLFITLLWMLFLPEGGFRKLLNHPLMKKGFGLVLCFWILGSSALLAQKKGTESVAVDTTIQQVLVGKRLSKQALHSFAKLKVYNQNQLIPIEVMAMDFTRKVVGQSRFTSEKGKSSALAFFSGWVFYPKSWMNVPMVAIENPTMRRRFHLPELASIADFYEADGSYKLAPYWHLMHRSGRKSAFMKEVEKADEICQIVQMARTGGLLRIYPVKANHGIQWYLPKDTHLPANINHGLAVFVEHGFDLLYTALMDKDYQQFDFLLQKHLALQEKAMPNTRWMQISDAAARLYCTIPMAKLLFMYCLTVGLLFMLARVIAMVRNKQMKAFVIAERVAYIFAVVAVGVMIVLLGIAARRWPTANGPETMSFLSLCALIIGGIFHKHSSLFRSFSMLLAGFALLVASIAMKSPHITPLIPVLSSPLLSVHVSLMMIADALSGFLFLNAVAAIILSYSHRRHPKSVHVEQVETLSVLSSLLLYPTVVAFGLGIFIGAIWGNVSWGRYWNWDPKEVWALINFMLYAAVLHIPLSKRLKHPVAFHTYLFVVFFTVLITYFGVNFCLGGMHSYA